ncbi:hypothetical protein [Vibrio furnissii]|uniref:hypothetical protein n=1 Tax=Vibrio furnissii TaxID=29494 RepID=UPI001EEA8184|nr:hypothetical protein [Vibrio furnissii]
MSQITTLEQLRALYHLPAPLAVAKDLHHIDQHTKTFGQCKYQGGDDRFNHKHRFDFYLMNSGIDCRKGFSLGMMTSFMIIETINQ